MVAPGAQCLPWPDKIQKPMLRYWPYFFFCLLIPGKRLELRSAIPTRRKIARTCTPSCHPDDFFYSLNSSQLLPVEFSRLNFCFFSTFSPHSYRHRFRTVQTVLLFGLSISSVVHSYQELEANGGSSFVRCSHSASSWARVMSARWGEFPTKILPFRVFSREGFLMNYIDAEICEEDICTSGTRQLVHVRPIFPRGKISKKKIYWK